MNRPPKRNLIIFAITLLLGFTLAGIKKVIATELDSQKGGGNYYDSGILENNSTSSRKNSNKKKKHYHGRKGSAKQSKNSMDQNPGGPQEDVTDQKEVSEQADQKKSKK